MRRVIKIERGIAENLEVVVDSDGSVTLRQGEDYIYMHREHAEELMTVLDLGLGGEE